MSGRVGQVGGAGWVGHGGLCRAGQEWWEGWVGGWVRVEVQVGGAGRLVRVG